MTPEPNTDRAWDVLKRALDLPAWKGMGWKFSRADLLDMIYSLLSDAGLWVGAYPDVPPWLAHAMDDDGEPLYVITPPEENQ